MSQETFTDICPTQLIYGSIKDKITRIIEGKECIIVTTSHSPYSLGIIDIVKQVFKENNVDYFIYDKITPNPLYTSVKECVDLTKNFGDFILGIGGGSAIDAAKAVSLMKNGVDILNSDGNGIPVNGILTLSGSGTEVTPFSILNLPNGTKKSIKAHMFLGKCLIDKDLQLHISDKYQCALVIDILSHCIESYLSVKATPRSMEASKKGIQMIFRHGKIGIQQVREMDCISASVIGGVAITVAGTSVPHGLGYYITTHYGISHGFACGVFSCAYLKLSEKQEICGKRLKLLYDELNIQSGEIGLFINNLLYQFMDKVQVKEQEVAIMVNEFLASGKNKQHPDFLDKNDIKDIIQESVSVIA
ncbi:alcohol dehydrogenase, putative [Entamoeba histolytica HM-1:IMSS-B]|uniref:Alcohol dehydrogenase, putative n=6 Tax=Entamoeba histolytica TaxID=5759 RepID=C4LZ92_ENTH1|nr:alcohol dehydrogenase, putative [Entamoeba histolytica HM-1:IMSS]EMD45570.1 alcohol dehydrogenase, putative [Entamoeba histolytica KU27]EMH75923.1 alcohol dehydrogenase, putative [Entamoeba histolytica HM-1:IMSS-B]EMS17710.1 alcohol dehydrogenase [Entamoeba histolytica HM-3:IMSS]ENY60159.1 alcohol dehydrogenase, putative [Entamoeba histolytica HM-1:IMSS-A]GAT94173.1 alcohol dehydrogenase putative [Entamoeba histolytica]|eukprot:XP_652753.2 alcohol dehydrogenase, putative [Entamoeba histolytica HM-1:IMSS]